LDSLMSGKIKYGKMLAVVFLTVLIWVWADLAKTEDYTVSHARITVAQSTNPDLWVSFATGASTSVEEVLLRGAASRIDTLKRSLLKKRQQFGEGLEFSLDPAQENMEEPGEHSLLVRPFLNKQMTKQFGLRVESCKPEKISVIVSRLVKKNLPVRCVDENGNLITANCNPAQVEIAIPQNADGTATVRLTAADVRRSQDEPIKKRPFFQTHTGQRLPAQIDVQITMPMGLLKPHTIVPRFGILSGPTIHESYSVVVENMTDVLAPISISATDEAKRAYENQRYQIILEVDDDDAKSTEWPVKKPLIYNFPEKFVRTGEIQPNTQPAQALFRLVPRTGAEGPTAGPQ